MGYPLYGDALYGGGAGAAGAAAIAPDADAVGGGDSGGGNNGGFIDSKMLTLQVRWSVGPLDGPSPLIVCIVDLILQIANSQKKTKMLDQRRRRTN